MDDTRYRLSTPCSDTSIRRFALRDAEVQAGFLATSLRDRKPDDNARYLAQWQAEGRVVVEKSAHRHTWIASITGSCTILCSAPASRVWQRMQASVELPLDHSAEECLRNSEYSLSPRVILVFGCAAAYGQGAGV